MFLSSYQRSDSNRTHTGRGCSQVRGPWKTADIRSVLHPEAANASCHASRRHKKSESETSLESVQALHFTGALKMAPFNNTPVVYLFCREFVTWSTHSPVMLSTSCGTTLKRTWVCWGRLWIRTWTTQPLPFIWFWTPAQNSLQVLFNVPENSATSSVYVKKHDINSAECWQRVPRCNTWSVLQTRTATVGEAHL